MHSHAELSEVDQERVYTKIKGNRMRKCADLSVLVKSFLGVVRAAIVLFKYNCGE